MRRVFTCLTSGRQRVLPSMAETVISADPDCPTLVVWQQQQNNKKNFFVVLSYPQAQASLRGKGVGIWGARKAGAPQSNLLKQQQQKFRPVDTARGSRGTLFFDVYYFFYLAKFIAKFNS